jgi:hypothetical protein
MGRTGDILLLEGVRCGSEALASTETAIASTDTPELEAWTKDKDMCDSSAWSLLTCALEMEGVNRAKG